MDIEHNAGSQSSDAIPRTKNAHPFGLPREQTWQKTFFATFPARGDHLLPNGSKPQASGSAHNQAKALCFIRFAEMQYLIHHEPGRQTGPDVKAKHKFELTVYCSLLSHYQDVLVAASQVGVKPTRIWQRGIEMFLTRPDIKQSTIFGPAIFISWWWIAQYLHDRPDIVAAWHECQGSLAQLAASVEQDEGFAHQWRQIATERYKLAIHGSPNTGRLYYRLATVDERPLPQMLLTTKALMSDYPYLQAEEFLQELAEAELKRGWENATESNTRIAFASFVTGELGPAITSWRLPQPLVDTVPRMLLTIASLVSCGNRNNRVWQHFLVDVRESTRTLGLDDDHLVDDYDACTNNNGSTPSLEDDQVASPDDISGRLTVDEELERVQYAFTMNLIKKSWETTHSLHPTLREIYVLLVWLYGLQIVRQTGMSTPPDPAYASVCELSPWDTICDVLNHILSQFGPIDSKSAQMARADAASPWAEVIRQGDPVMLPEDLQMQGFSWAQHYLPDDYFSMKTANVDPFGTSETKSQRNVRMARVAGLGIFLAERLPHISYHENHRFSVTASPRSVRSLASTVLDSGDNKGLCDVVLSTMMRKLASKQNARLEEWWMRN